MMPSIPINTSTWTDGLAATQSGIFNRYQDTQAATRIAASTPAQSSGYDHVSNLQLQQRLAGGRPLTQTQVNSGITGNVPSLLGA
jgi:hypothetical protein